MEGKTLKFVLIVFIGSLQLARSANDAIDASLVVAKATRTVDISSQIVRMATELVLENTGKSSIKSFLVSIDPEMQNNIAFIDVSQENNPGLPLTKTTVSQHQDKSFWKVDLKQPIEPAKSQTVTVSVILTHYLVAYPLEISQSERQLILFSGNHYVFAPYTVRTQMTKVMLSTSSVESYSKLKPVSQSESTISYGPYENIVPFTINKMTVHYENNNNFLTVTKLKRTIEVSHWGMISVEEEVNLRHTGAVLKGSFSRYEYQKEHSGVSSVKSFVTILPAAASDVYYRDEIGNISTSHMRVLDDSVSLELRPRFPLFGGWKTHYLLGYNVPAYEYLYNSGNQYILKMRFVDHIFDDSIVDDAELKLILPEGVINIKLNIEYPVERAADGKHYTYLDTLGRPIITLKKKNLVEAHIKEFEVHYQFNRISMLQEPLLMVLAFFLLFMLVIVYVRMDFTISKDSHKETLVRVAGILESIHLLHEKCADIYAQFDTTISKFKSSKDNSTFNTTMKKLNSDHKTIVQSISDLLTKLKHEGVDEAEKVSELQRLDRSMKEQFQQQQMLVDKLVSGKTSKQQYMDAEGAITKKKEELVEKMQGIVASL